MINPLDTIAFVVVWLYTKWAGRRVGRRWLEAARKASKL